MNEVLVILLSLRVGGTAVIVAINSRLSAVRGFMIALLMIAAPIPTHAQGGGTEQERAACAPDVKRHCVPSISQGDLAILACLQQNRAKLSRECNQVLVNHGQ